MSAGLPPADCRRWFIAYSLIDNHLVVVVDADYNCEHAMTIRRRLLARLTRVVKLRRRDLAAFRHKWRIARVQRMSSQNKTTHGGLGDVEK